MSNLPRFLRLRNVLFASAMTAGVLFGCSASEPSKKASTLCKPGTDSYCRCKNRDEGIKTCNEKGDGYGLCDPCETPENPEVPYEPGEEPDGEPPPRDKDASTTDAPVSTGACGNGTVDDGEDCDDKNTNDTDGCDSKCKLAGFTPIGTPACPGLDVHVWSAPVVWTGTTQGAPNAASSTACATNGGVTGSAAPDRLFKVTPHKSGTLKVVTSDAAFNGYLYAVSTTLCKSTGQMTALVCSNRSDTNSGENIELAVTKDKPVTIVVDGAGIQSNAGSVKVTFSML